jgi:hypothetical protein
MTRASNPPATTNVQTQRARRAVDEFAKPTGCARGTSPAGTPSGCCYDGASTDARSAGRRDAKSFVAEVISLPRYFEQELTTQRFEGLTEELGVHRGAEVTEQSLTSMLEQIALETGAAKRAPRHAVMEVIETVLGSRSSSP